MMFIYACTIMLTIICESQAYYEKVTTPNVGTVLFSSIDVNKKQWAKTDIGLLRARKYFQTLLPPPVFINTFSEDYVNILLGYFRDAYAAIKRESPDPETDTIMTTALSDAIGGYLKVWVLPVAKLDYYGGTVSQENVLKLFQFYNEIKRYLDTDGTGWRKPDEHLLNSMTINVAPLKLVSNTRSMNDPCDHLAYFEKTPSGLTIPIPNVHWNDKLSTLFIPLKNTSLIPMNAPDTANHLMKYYDSARGCIQASNPKEQDKFDEKFQVWLAKDVVPHLKDENLYLALGSVLSLVNRTRDLCTNVVDLYGNQFNTIPHRPSARIPIDLTSKKMCIISVILLIEVAWCIPALIYILCSKKVHKKDCSSNVYLFIDNNKPDNKMKNKNSKASKSKTYINEDVRSSFIREIPFTDTHGAGPPLKSGIKLFRRSHQSNMEFEAQYPSSMITNTVATGTRSYFSSKDQSASAIRTAVECFPRKSAMKKTSSPNFSSDHTNSTHILNILSLEALNNGPERRTNNSYVTIQESPVPAPTAENDRYIRGKRERTTKREKIEERKRAEEWKKYQEKIILEERVRAEEERKFEERRLAEEYKKFQERIKADEAKRLEDMRRAEEARQIEERKRAEELRRQEDLKKAEDSRRLEELRRAEESRRLEELRRADEKRRQDELKRAEEMRRIDETKKGDDIRRIEEFKKAEELRKQQERKKIDRLDEHRKSEERKKADGHRKTNERNRSGDSRKSEGRKICLESRKPEERKRSAESRSPEERKRSAESRIPEERKRSPETRRPEERKRSTESRNLEESKRNAESRSTETINLETRSPETRSPETRSPETRSPETRSPETRSPETRSPETRSPETRSPETRSPETRSPETRRLETRSPETKSPEIRSTETRSPETRSPEERKRSAESRSPEERKIIAETRHLEERKRSTDSRNLEERERSTDSRSPQERKKSVVSRNSEDRRRASGSGSPADRKRSEASKKPEERKKGEDSRKLEERKRPEECRRVEEFKKVDDRRKVDESRKHEERRADEIRKYEERKKHEERRKHEERKRVNTVKRQEDRKKIEGYFRKEDEKTAEEIKRIEDGYKKDASKMKESTPRTVRPPTGSHKVVEIEKCELHDTENSEREINISVDLEASSSCKGPMCACAACLEDSTDMTNVGDVTSDSLADSKVVEDKQVETKTTRFQVTKEYKTSKRGIKVTSGKPYLEITIDRPATEISVDVGGIRAKPESPSKPSKIPKLTCNVIQPANATELHTSTLSPIEKRRSLIPQLKKKTVDDLDVSNCHCPKSDESRLNDTF